MGRWFPTPGEPRNWGRAFVLTLAVPLVGYAYVGRLERSLLALAVGLMAAAALSYLPFGLAHHRPFAALAAAAFVIARPIWAIDAALLVRRGRSRVGVPDQSVLVYVGVFALSLGAMLGYKVLAGDRIFTAEQLCGKSRGVEPAIWPGDCVITAPAGRFERGDLVYYGGRFGRIVGLPGDLIELRDGVPVVNGAPFVQTPAPNPPNEATSFQPDMVIASTETNPEGRSYVVLRLKRPEPRAGGDMAERRVADGHVFVLTDLRDANSGFDSRAVGDVSMTDFLGMAVMISRSPEWDRVGTSLR